MYSKLVSGRLHEDCEEDGMESNNGKAPTRMQRTSEKERLTRTAKKKVKIIQ